MPILEASGFMVLGQWPIYYIPRTFSVVIAADLWARKHVFFRSDNEAVVAILTTRTSKVPAFMHLRDLLSAACCGF